MIKCIDFDEKFGKYAEGWIAANRSKYKNMDLLEEQIPELYLRWLNAPADWLDGKTPGEWFNQFEDANELVELMRAYQKAKINLPDPLLERVTDLGEEAVEPLMQLVREYNQDRGLAISALNLLIELGSSAPMEMCLDIISRADGQNELTDVASELLGGLGEEVIEPVIARMENVSRTAEDCFLDVLCNFPGDERIYTYTVNAFNRRYDRRALYASYLGKLGDARAIEILLKAMDLSDISYLDYIEIVNAIEALGGEVSADREFNGDPYYESLKKMK